jgi:uncharacterized protein
MIIAVTGATGFVGSALTARLRRDGHQVRPISIRSAPEASAFEGCDAVVHLAGEPIAQRWTAAAKRRILGSRVEGTRSVVEALAKLQKRPRVLVSSSGVGFYGSRGEEALTENAAPGDDFLAEVCVAWEAEAQEAASLGIRVVTPRTAMVLGPDGGALAKLLLPFRMGVGGRIGSGTQWVSWVHRDDLISLILVAIEKPDLDGPVNAVAPNPVTNLEFTKTLAAELHRPAIVPVPGIALKLLYGEMSDVLLGGQRAIPEAALRAGFEFRFPRLDAALREILVPK